MDSGRLFFETYLVAISVPREEDLRRETETEMETGDRETGDGTGGTGTAARNG